MNSLWSNLGTVLCAVECSVVYYVCYTLSLILILCIISSRDFIESYVIVFHDSYIILTLKVSSSPVFSLEHWLDRVSLSGCISALVCATMVVQLAGQRSFVQYSC